MSNIAAPSELVQEYLQRVEDLYADVRAWIESIDKEATITEVPVELREGVPGEYTATALEILMTGARHPVRFLPKGRWIIGALGRVDLVSALGSEAFVLITHPPGFRAAVPGSMAATTDDEEADTPYWAWVETRGRGNYPRLTQEIVGDLVRILAR